MSDGGKGSNPRPFSVNKKTFDNNWDLIFRNAKIIEEKMKKQLEEELFKDYQDDKWF